MRSLRGLMVASIGVVALLAAACSSGSDNDSASSGSNGGGSTEWLDEARAVVAERSEIPTEIPSNEFGPVTPPEGVSIFHIACDLSLEDCALKSEAMEEASSELGYDYEVCDAGTSPDSTAQCFTNAVNATPSVVITNGVGVAEAGDGYAALAQAGIPIVGSSTGNDPGVEGVATEVAGDSCRQQGEVVGDWVVADSDGEANVIFFATETFKCNQQRRAGFESSLEKCPSCTSDVIEFSIDSIQTTLTQQVSSAIQANPDVDYIIGTFDQVALQATDAVRQSGRDIKVAGFDGNSPNLELIQQGDIQAADIAAGRVEPGWELVDVATRVVAGQELPEITPVNFVLITEENIDEFANGFEGAVDFKEQFRALWGLA